MAGWRQVVELAMSNEEVARLAAISRSRTEPASRWSGRKCFLPPENASYPCGYESRRPSPDGPTLRRTGAGVWSPGGARRPTATWQGANHHAGGRNWLVSLACDKAKEHGLSPLFGPRALLARSARCR